MKLAPLLIALVALALGLTSPGASARDHAKVSKEHRQQSHKKHGKKHHENNNKQLDEGVSDGLKPHDKDKNKYDCDHNCVQQGDHKLPKGAVPIPKSLKPAKVDIRSHSALPADPVAALLDKTAKDAKQKAHDVHTHK